MSKKILCFLSVCLLAVFMSTGVFADNAKIELNVPETAPKAGETFEVTVDISGNPGISGVMLSLEYDSDLFECTSVKAGDVLEGSLTATNTSADDGARFVSASTDKFEENGNLAVFTFKAKTDVKSADFKLQNAYISGGEDGETLLSVELPDGTKTAVSSGTVSQGSATQNPGTSSGGGATGQQGAQTGKEESTTPADAVKESAFKDVTTHWGREFIEKAVERGLFKGYTDGTFKPDLNVTRAQFVTVLYRMAGSPDTEVNTPFTDISGQIPEFQKAIAWAYKNGYVNGVTETSFNPAGTLTREAAMKILFFYSGGKTGLESMLYSTYDSTYTDSGEISAWAKAPIYWGIYKELISGTSGTTLSPKGTATRAQLAKILVNYIEKIK